MNQHEAGLIAHMIHEPEPEMAICQNPNCNDAFTTDTEELFCPECMKTLDPRTKWNIRYAIDHGIMPEQVVAHILNGETR